MSQPVSIQPKSQTDLDVLTKLDLIDSDDMEEVLKFLDKLLAQSKYEGRRENTDRIRCRIVNVSEAVHLPSRPAALLGTVALGILRNVSF